MEKEVEVCKNCGSDESESEYKVIESGIRSYETGDFFEGSSWTASANVTFIEFPFDVYYGKGSFMYEPELLGRKFVFLTDIKNGYRLSDVARGEYTLIKSFDEMTKKVTVYHSRYYCNLYIDDYL